MGGKHFCQGLKGRERTMKRNPPRIRIPPAEPTQATDQDSWWWTGMEWSLDSRARRDWWNTSTARRTSTPAHGTQSQLQRHEEEVAALHAGSSYLTE